MRQLYNLIYFRILACCGEGEGMLKMRNLYKQKCTLRLKLVLNLSNHTVILLKLENAKFKNSMVVATAD